MSLPNIIEALLTASQDPLTTEELTSLIQERGKEIAEDLAEIAEAKGDGESEESVLTAEDLKAAPEAEPEPELTNESSSNPQNITDIKGADHDNKEDTPSSLIAEELNHDALLAVTEDDILTAINTLNELYCNTHRSFTVLERAKGWKIYTTPAYADFVRLLFPGQKPRRLSGPAMETLAVVAYRQPITKSAIEAVRGVSCDGMLQKLLDAELIHIQGRADLPGRPLLYETTELFFEHFGVKSVDDLPNSQELRNIPLPEASEEEELEQENAQKTASADPEPTADDPANPSSNKETEKQLTLADAESSPPDEDSSNEEE